MGASWKFLFKPFLFPIYDWIDRSPFVRKFATDFIYTKEAGTDFMAISFLVILSSTISLAVVFYWQFQYETLPFWLVISYYCCWVGVGGRMMGAAYALGHKEGHNHHLYRKWIRDSVGNFFENKLGMFFGNIPYSFSVSHVFIHHRLDGGIGDTFYQWDLDRSSIFDFVLYVSRIFLHMIGYSSIKYFDAHGQTKKSGLIKKGILQYLTTGAVIVALLSRYTSFASSLSFIFWIYFQPLFCMTYFLALLNFGFHGFIEFDEAGKSLPYVNSTTIIEGDDDYFGEDDHMAHHYNANVTHRDLLAHQASKVCIQVFSPPFFTILHVLNL